jgi:hypothetical protein
MNEAEHRLGEGGIIDKCWKKNRKTALERRRNQEETRDIAA